MLSAWTLRAVSLAARSRSAQHVCSAGFAKARAQPATGERRDSAVDQVLELLQPDLEKPPTLSAEEEQEWNARAKEYSKHKMAEHRAWQKALSTKLKLKLAALKALPEELRAHAAVEDLTPAPLSRRIPTLTPPSPEYRDARQSTAATPGRRIGTRK